MSSSESTLKCGYGAGTSRGCQPAMTGTKEQREKPLCGTLPDWNVWRIGGPVAVSPAVPGGVFTAKRNGERGPPPTAGAKGGGARKIPGNFPPPCFTSIPNSPPSPPY